MLESKSMASDSKLAHAVGGKSVRACDNCIKKRARWYCAADDAFLCDFCDSSVHSANPLASRHERVRLKNSSSKENEENFSTFSFGDEVKVDVPSWQKGFTRKARTPRQKKNPKLINFMVPEQEVCSEDEDEDENEEQLLYRVPVFDVEKKYGGENGNFSQEMNDFVPSEMDLAEFAADVESLLGKGLEEEAFDMEGLGIFDDHRDGDGAGQGKECCLRIKDEDEEIGGNLIQFDDLGRETFELNFDYASPITYEEEENKAQNQENKGLLKLDYDRVMSAWDYRKSPWMTGQRPEFTADADWWPDYCSGTSGIMHAYGDVGMAGGLQVAAAVGGGGREARVSRYREKRRTRLFSKKIRYEVRKLNAEKRPRMKGRFVKRASFAPSAAFPPLLNK